MRRPATTRAARCMTISCGCWRRRKQALTPPAAMPPCPPAPWPLGPWPRAPLPPPPGPLAPFAFLAFCPLANAGPRAKPANTPPPWSLATRPPPYSLPFDRHARFVAARYVSVRADEIDGAGKMMPADQAKKMRECDKQAMQQKIKNGRPHEVRGRLHGQDEIASPLAAAPGQTAMPAANSSTAGQDVYSTLVALSVGPPVHRRVHVSSTAT